MYHRRSDPVAELPLAVVQDVVHRATDARSLLDAIQTLTYRQENTREGAQRTEEHMRIQ